VKRKKKRKEKKRKREKKEKKKRKKRKKEKKINFFLPGFKMLKWASMSFSKAGF